MNRIDPSALKKLIDNQQTFNHFISLQTKLKLKFLNNVHQYNSELLDAIQQSPTITHWVRDSVLPKIYNGDNGLDEILLQIEQEKDTLISATKMQILLDIMESIPESLNELRDKAEEGEYDVEKNIQDFSNSIKFKYLH